jgi:hypothetical protein
VVCVCVTFFTFSWVESSRHQWCLDAVIEDVYQKGKGHPQETSVSLEIFVD